MTQVVPIRVTGKEGGSLRATRAASPQPIPHSGTVRPTETFSLSFNVQLEQKAIIKQTKSLHFYVFLSHIFPVDRFNPPGSVVSSVKSSQSFMTHKRNSDDSPPEPPPFPKDVVKTDKERVIFL